MASWSTAGMAVRPRAWRAALVLPALAVLAVLAADRTAAATAAATVSAGNAVCPSGYDALKVDRPYEGSHAFDDGTLRGSYTVSGKRLDWGSDTAAVDYVLVKGGPSTNVYSYEESWGETGQYAPDNASGGPADISHFTLCYKDHHRGRVTIVKKTSPAGSDQRFGFHPSAGLSPDDFELGDGDVIEFRPKPGTHTVEEAATPGWKLTGIECDDDDSTGSGRTATIVVDPDEDITCSFYNVKEQAPPPVVPPTRTVPPPAPTPPSLAPPPPASAPVAVRQAPAAAVKGTTVRRATASAGLRRLSCASRRVRVTVTGSPIRRIAFWVNGRHVRTFVPPRRRGTFTVTLPAASGPVSRVTARVSFTNGLRSRTLRTAVPRCAQRQVRPQFTG